MHAETHLQLKFATQLRVLWRQWPKASFECCHRHFATPTLTIPHRYEELKYGYVLFCQDAYAFKPLVQDGVIKDRAF